MTILILGVLLWSLPHLGKRLVPGFHSGLKGAERPMVAGLVTLGVILMVIGYRAAEGTVLWGRHPATVGVNNLLMLAAIYLFAAAGMKTAFSAKLRHPMLLAVVFWAVAHLLVNGDTPSFVLFGGIGAWALITIRLINRTSWTRAQIARNPRKEAAAGIGTLVVYGAIAGAHYALGLPAFG